MTTNLEWNFPLPRTHTGLPLGNGRTGLLIWGSGNRLCITIGRADLWDHRGGMPWSSEQSYENIRTLLEAGDEQGIRELFRPAQDAPSGAPSRPTVLPFGRVEVLLPEGTRLRVARLSLLEGVATVVAEQGREERTIEILLHPEDDVALIRSPLPLSIRGVPSWELMREKLEAVSHRAPETFEGDQPGGWFWKLPADPGVYAAWGETERKLPSDGRTIALAVGRADSSAEARVAAATTIAAADPSAMESETLGWWKRYWRRTARVDLPNRVLQEIHDYGLYLFAGLTNPSGVPATLQGPWIEEYAFPPWSSDYHFNINVQMCYSPACRAGLAEHLLPLFELVNSWKEQLRENARYFVGVEDGQMLPHAVDDRAMCMGSFWTGTIDHACTAWVAQMMYDYANYTGDLEFLNSIALPFMGGAFAVYRGMLEDTGGALSLPVSVSPEYRGASMDAWGRDASFQLAALHRLIENLQSAATLLGLEQQPVWAEVQQRLPQVTLIGDGDESRIALWEGTDLEASHRHHSHLGAIAPFDTIDARSPAWASIVERSLRHWIATGMGLWSGWCMSWASQIHSRVGNGNGAEMLLELWRRVFVNEGRASMHDVEVNGLTIIGAPPIARASAEAASSESQGAAYNGMMNQAERMQMDGAMGGVAAVQEMLVHERRGTICVFPAIPSGWPSAAFDGMHAPGGFVLSGRWERDEGWQITARATRAARLRLLPPESPYRWQTADGPQALSSDEVTGTFVMTLAAGQSVVIDSMRRLPR